jgi:hypothetical protein
MCSLRCPQRCDGCRTLWGGGELGEGRLPRTLDLQRLRHILHQLPQLLAGVSARTFSMPIAKRALHRMGPRTVGGPIEELKARRGGAHWSQLNGSGGKTRQARDAVHDEVRVTVLF